MHNEIILMKDVEWIIINDKHGEYKDVLLPSAKIININCNGVIIHNVIRIIFTYDDGFGIFYKEHPFSLERKRTTWYKLPGDVPLSITGSGNITVRDFELVVETMSEFFIQIIDPTFHDHDVQNKIDVKLRVEARYASYTEEKKRKFDQHELESKRRWTAIFRRMGYKT